MREVQPLRFGCHVRGRRCAAPSLSQQQNLRDGVPQAVHETVGKGRGVATIFSSKGGWRRGGGGGNGLVRTGGVAVMEGWWRAKPRYHTLVGVVRLLRGFSGATHG